jgi:serine/threonine-protein kinase
MGAKVRYLPVARGRCYRLMSGMSQSMQLGRYSLHAQLAGGGMATVYLARLNGAVGFGRTVAIKRLHPHLAKDPEFVTMFLDEARLSARIQHPNVVPTLDVVATDGELFLVLEYVKGETLSVVNRAMARQKAFIPVPIVASLVVGMLNGLDAAHEARDERGAPLEIVHRDVSPQNVMVGADGVARILDFGIAKAASRLGNTREGQLKGKIAYMAPEQLMGTVSRQTDIYAAGVVLWEELTGRRLFYAESEVHTMVLVQKGDIPRPSSLNPAVPGALDEIVMKALARNPEDRFRTAHEMASAIESVTELTSPNKVAEWLKGVAGELIDARAKLVKEIESGVRAPGPMQVFDQLRSPGVQDSGPYSASASGGFPSISGSNPAFVRPSSHPSHPSQSGPFGPLGTGSTRISGLPDPNFVPTQSASTLSLGPPKGQGTRNTIIVAGAAMALLLLVGGGVLFARRAQPNSLVNARTGPSASTLTSPLPPPESVVPQADRNGQNAQAAGDTSATRPSGSAAIGGSAATAGSATAGRSAPTVMSAGAASAVPGDARKDPHAVTQPPKQPPPPPKNPKNGNDLDNLLDSR